MNKQALRVHVVLDDSLSTCEDLLNKSDMVTLQRGEYRICSLLSINVYMVLHH